MAETEGAGERPQLNRWVYQQLREAIVTGQFVPGRSVTLRGVAEQLGVSPMPVREALRQLVAERALAMHDNRRVAVPEMSAARLEELGTARVLLEGELAERALPHIDGVLAQALRRLDREVDPGAGAGPSGAVHALQSRVPLALYRAARRRCCCRWWNRCGCRSGRSCGWWWAGSARRASSTGTGRHWRRSRHGTPGRCGRRWRRTSSTGMR